MDVYVKLTFLGGKEGDILCMFWVILPLFPSPSPSSETVRESDLLIVNRALLLRPGIRPGEVPGEQWQCPGQAGQVWREIFLREIIFFF